MDIAAEILETDTPLSLACKWAQRCVAIETGWENRARKLWIEFWFPGSREGGEKSLRCKINFQGYKVDSENYIRRVERRTVRCAVKLQLGAASECVLCVYFGLQVWKKKKLGGVLAKV